MTVSPRILVRLTLPTVLIGLLLSGCCLLGIWSINRLQADRAIILSKDVRTLQAAEEMVVCLRQLRFHSFLYLMDRTKARAASLNADHHRFEQALGIARELVDIRRALEAEREASDR